jgi:YD repeat-containing protein
MIAAIQRRTARVAVIALALLGLLDPCRAKAADSFGYDVLGRIVTARYDNGSCIVYAYDATGNRTSQVSLGPPQTSPPLWDAGSWGSFTWSSAPQWPVWGAGSVWGCFQWTPQ